MSLGLLGILLTSAYFALIIFLFGVDIEVLKTATPNELGDFLAGTFGAPAFLWVVIGFFLQSRELANSVSALNLQQEQLAESANAQKQLVLSYENLAERENERYVGSLRLEASKYSSDVSADLEKLPELITEEKLATQTGFALRGVLQSGAHERQKEENQKMSQVVTKLREEHRSLVSPKSLATAQELETLTASFYDLRNRSLLLVNKLEGRIQAMRKERELVLAERASTRPAPPISPYGSGNPPRR